MSVPTPTPARDDPRDAPLSARTCPLCTGPLLSVRARYCSHACRQRAFRLRHPARAPVNLDALTRRARQQQTLGAHTVYECPTCSTRFLGERRCPDCNRFCRSLGLGGACPDCDAVLLLVDLLSPEVLR